MNLFFAFFFLSGFCGLVYQVVWLRVAMANFGVTTPLISIVLSVFMAGLALGSWAGGRLVDRLAKRPASLFVRMYAGAEFLIGISGLAVIPLLQWGRGLLMGQWGSSGYYLVSAAWIALVMLPFCTAMGATFPLAMAGIRAAYREESPRSFSYLYVANVLGAMAGTLASAFVLIELLGFSHTVLVASACNGLVATGAMAAAARMRGAAYEEASSAGAKIPGDRTLLLLLFTSGLCSLAMEVVWTRQFVPFLGPLVYSFASMLAIYLAATAVGSRLYRIWIRRRALHWMPLTLLAGVCALFPLLAADPRFFRGHLFTGVLRMTLGVAGFCGVLGFLTPHLIDRWSDGDPRRAGRAYAVNAVGCILGPLVAGFLLLPNWGEHWTLVLLALPFFLFGLRSSRRFLFPAAAIAIALLAFTRDFERRYPHSVVLRDHTATVIAAGTGMKKELLVNGVGITSLTPITKMMAHLPLASLDAPPVKVLVICFGMGTSFRSAYSWGSDVTAIDLVPSVPKLFDYFFPGGQELLHSPRTHLIIDDGRRFLERVQDRYDVIVIDPPPPVEAAGSSLLYSEEFYRVAASRLRPGGILQQWIPQAEATMVASAARSLVNVFPYVRVFGSVEHWGQHFLASNRPMPRYSAAQLADRVPASAAHDMLEWGPEFSVEAQFGKMVSGEVSVADVLLAAPNAPALTDDRPINEYYLIRRQLHGLMYFDPYR